MYSNVIKERNNDFNFIPPFPPFPPLEKVEPNSHFFCNFIIHFGRFGSTFPKGGKGGLFRKIQKIFGSTFPKGGCG
jgi:hypothetical protein